MGDFSLGGWLHKKLGSLHLNRLNVNRYADESIQIPNESIQSSLSFSHEFLIESIHVHNGLIHQKASLDFPIELIHCINESIHSEFEQTLFVFPIQNFILQNSSEKGDLRTPFLTTSNYLQYHHHFHKHHHHWRHHHWTTIRISPYTCISVSHLALFPYFIL